MKTKKTFDKLVKENKDHKVISALAGVLYKDSLDMKINVIGAIHTSGWLKNRIKPFWSEYNHGTEEWINRCITRAIENDFDDYSVSALLNCDIESVVSEIKKLRLKFVSSRYYDDFKMGRVNVLTFAQSIDEHSKRLLTKVIEFGWIDGTNEIIDVASMRATLFDTEYKIKEHQIYGKSFSTYFRRALLPYGNWNLPQSEPFEFSEDFNIFNKLKSEIKEKLILIG